ncbi:MAG TPA: ribosomal-processing cysteine protease Prp [Bacillota bacterium]
MTNIQFFTTAEGKFAGFCAQGHAGYARRGQDIVCAGISTLIQTTALGLEKLVKAGLHKKVQTKKGLFFCALTPENSEEQKEQAHLLLSNMYLGLTELAKEYDEYLRVSLKEVE